NGAPAADVFRWGDRYPLRAETPSGGTYLYFTMPPDVELVGKWMPGVDVKAGGKGYVLLPPSRREDGKAYSWYGVQVDLAESIDELFLTALPEWLLTTLTKPERLLDLGGNDKTST